MAAPVPISRGARGALASVSPGFPVSAQPVRGRYARPPAGTAIRVQPVLSGAMIAIHPAAFYRATAFHVRYVRLLEATATRGLCVRVPVRRLFRLRTAHRRRALQHRLERRNSMQQSSLSKQHIRWPSAFLISLTQSAPHPDARAEMLLPGRESNNSVSSLETNI